MLRALALLLVILGAVQSFKPLSMNNRALSRVGSSLMMAEKGRLTTLCEITKEACDAVQPMLFELYSQIRVGTGDSSTAKFKR
jgi:hypothetical protein